MDDPNCERIAHRSTRGEGRFAKSRWAELSVYYMHQVAPGGRRWYADDVWKRNEDSRLRSSRHKCSHQEAPGDVGKQDDAQSDDHRLHRDAIRAGSRHARAVNGDIPTFGGNLRGVYIDAVGAAAACTIRAAAGQAAA